MQISRYSAPEFDPYGEARQTEPDDGWRAPVAAAPLESVVALPGSKSLTNRELVLAALADAPSTLRAPLWSRDSELMLEGLQAMGTRFERMPATGGFGDDLRVIPADELLGSTTIDCGLAGTVMRFLVPMVRSALPSGVVADVATVSSTVAVFPAPSVTDAGVKAAVVLAGRPETVGVTLPLNPLVGVKDTE